MNNTATDKDKGSALTGSRKGFTLLESIIASGIFAMVSLITLTSFTSMSTQMALHTNVSYQQTFGNVQLNKIVAELSETKMSGVCVSYINNTDIPADLRFALSFPTARDADGKFSTSESSPIPVWQGVVLYYSDLAWKAPLSSMPDTYCLYKTTVYGTFTYPLSVAAVSATELTLSNGDVIDKGAFTAVLNDVLMFRPTVGNPNAIDLRLNARAADLGKKSANIDYHVEVTSRN